MPAAYKPPYESKIIKAGALLANTRILLSRWDGAVSVQKNIDFLHQEYAVKTDRLLYDMVIELFLPLKAQRLADIDVIAIEKCKKFPARYRKVCMLRNCLCYNLLVFLTPGRSPFRRSS